MAAFGLTLLRGPRGEGRVPLQGLHTILMEISQAQLVPRWG